MKLEMQHIFPAPRTRVFQAWTDREMLLQWFHPPGSVLQKADIDLRVGGIYRFWLTNSQVGEFQIFGIYREIIAPEKLVFTWNNPLIHDFETVVTLQFVEAGANQTELLMSQVGFVSELILDDYRAGWLALLPSLELSVS